MSTFVKNKDIQAFGLLKQKIVERMQQSYPGINPAIEAWKGQEIVDFQEELLQKVKAHISEKWFYIHIKSDNGTLPRIDVLNLLSRYVGFENWNDFRYRSSGLSEMPLTIKNANHYFIYIPATALLILGILFLVFKLMSTREYLFHFYDADTKEPVVNGSIEVNVLRENESPVSYLCKPDGSLTLKTGKASIRFVVESPCYHTDTFFRYLDKFNREESVKLRPDNYALMIQYFSTMNVKDWQKRRTQLNQIISDSAIIYEVYNKEKVGLELYNKSEFINKISLPSTGLKGIEILDTKYQGSKISLIRFRQRGNVR